jgi:uncharacterized protein (TIGR02246 family)
MRFTLLLAALFLSIAGSTSAQVVSAEQEVTNLLNKLRDAGKRNDAAFFETVLAPEYTYSTPSGSVESRSAVLDYFRKLKETQQYRTLAHEMSDQQVRVFGDIAIVTGNFRFLSEFKAAHPNDPPHVDEGRYTGVLQKRDGRWLVLMEHDSEKPHDKAVMEKQVAALGRAYTDMIRRNDAASISTILADDYMVTDEEGNRLTKEQDLATYKERASAVKIETVEYKDQKVRMLTGSIAIEHSTIRFTGSRSGKPFDITERITTTWQFRDGRWLIVADHFSYVKP